MFKIAPSELATLTHPQQSQSVTSRPTFDPQLLQIKTNGNRPDKTSKSVTSTDQNRVLLLQIETVPNSTAPFGERPPQVRRPEAHFFPRFFLDGISPVVVLCPSLKTRGLFWALATFLPRNRAVGCVAFFVLAAGTTCTARRPHEPTFRLQGTDARDVHLQDSRRKGA